ncbi:ImcF-related family protein [Yersinia pseudotuberculosis]|uniref:ImcF-related family protein n=3 Tax=Yersinia pseudotuberculosis TaxID=633 RepID=UPI0004F6033E|nr:type VI secretion system membrane subunit [Yersinia pseudotuberculosis]AIN15731.1 intracellular multiplication and macrophage-killing family protein [Yersinia pseudotuberculosis]
MKRIALPIKKPEVWFWIVALLFLLAGAVLCWLVWQHPERVGLIPGTSQRDRWLTGLVVGTGILTLCALLSYVGTRLSGRKHFDELRQQAQGDDAPLPEENTPAGETLQGEQARLKTRLRRRYGLFWRYKVRLLMVVGEPDEITALAPQLAEQGWLEGQRTVLIHGGSLQNPADETGLSEWRKLRRDRPFDGIVWGMTAAQSSHPQWMDNGLRTLEKMGATLRYQPPVYLWQVCGSGWPQDTRAEQPVGVVLPAKATPEQVELQLRALLPQLREQGMQQLSVEPHHDFLLRLAQSLEQGDAARWRQRLTPWFTEYAARIPLRGLMFSLPDTSASAARVHEKSWTAPDRWQGVLDDCRSARGRRVGLPWEQTLCYSLLALIVLWGVGSVVSFAVNRHQMVSAAQQAQQLAQSQAVSDQQLMALQALRNDIGRLQSRVDQGAPWYQRFGLNHNAPLLEVLMPWYGQANNRILRDATAQSLHQKLSELAELPANSPQRAAQAKTGYDQLKAYLMMARPEKADAAFYAQVMQTTEPVRAGVSPGLWQSLAPDLWQFYAQNLPAQPDWKIKPDTVLISQVRQVLLGQIGQRNAESTLYENMLLSVRRNYADMTLMDMTGDTDAQRLFQTSESVPGMFTRKAWDEQIQQAIDKTVASRREEIDWVLSDNRRAISEEISPEALKKRLTERYFTDFAGSWLSFLNSLHWNEAHNLSDVIDQLTLMSDVRQSPLIALMNTLAWQGQTGQQDQALSDSLVKSAKALMNKDQAPAIDQSAGGPVGPLDETFGPLLALMGKGDAQNRMSSDSSLSLQTLLTRVTRVRLKLQQVVNASDPQEMTQVLAQTVFQGKSVDLTDTQEYGSLIAASLGEEWSSFGQAMFVQPLTQAWETVLQPSSASLNDQWKNAVVANWKSAFDGRYPFAASKSDASLPMLAEFIRKDSGRIDSFLTRELGGVLHKEGTRWVPSKVNSQGLTFNPDFLAAINQLSQVSDILFTDGSQGLRFELLARPVPNVVETNLAIDGQKLHYFNQMESWQSFRWPGDTYKPGTLLTWTGVNSGARLYGDYQGTWGLIRWLEQAKQKKLDEGRYQLTFTTADNQSLQWILRTELGKGPLGLLQLRNFTLPAQIFLIQNAPPAASDRTDDEDMAED